MQKESHRRIHQLERIAICGLGLIGGSVLKALRAAGYTGHVTAFDIDPAVAQQVCAEGFANEVALSADRLFLEHDLVILCQPVGVVVQYLLEQPAQIAAGRAIGIDVASVKGPVAQALRAGGAAVQARFVPCHPIAGKASHGWAAAQADLLDGKLCILTPEPGTPQPALDLALEFWSLLGARTGFMAAQEHDAVYAAVSHMPQLLTYAYLHGLAAREHTREWLAYRGTGFKSFTRLGSSDARLWADIATHNAASLIEEIDSVSASLALFRQRLAQGQVSELAEDFASARALHAGSETAG
ncbi:prephenate dehydrogenase [Herbaspirillum lusitanum]|uniref:Prephenate dehydrogenase n=1 Tax=Herbaspirillum lusitanum TaxID=213312 RepID=A0ABW9A4A2_9BURK